LKYIFLFDYKEQRRQHKTKMVAALVKQLAYHRKESQPRLEQLYEIRCNESIPACSTLVHCFLSCAKEFGDLNIDDYAIAPAWPFESIERIHFGRGEIGRQDRGSLSK